VIAKYAGGEWYELHYLQEDISAFARKTIDVHMSAKINWN